MGAYWPRRKMSTTHGDPRLPAQEAGRGHPDAVDRGMVEREPQPGAAPPARPRLRPAEPDAGPAERCRPGAGADDEPRAPPGTGPARDDRDVDPAPHEAA